MSLTRRAVELKSRTDVAAGGAATEHAKTELCVDSALSETLRRVLAIGTRASILMRIIDHACTSEQCISHRVLAMLRGAPWKIVADLHNDQPIDACGYIAADAVCRLRDAALSEADNWHHIQLPDYAQGECISRGNKILRKQHDDGILDADEVNRLVR